ncbi:hypothetical protein [Mycolicibacterium vanbaalenii]|uniref:hypothetical protein n=1 Tax=Mycolicibacterium vanbaalenii TaxID=110539 RepID=UPI0013303221|nr:hypothetical protein [Mycolicibacterium vanbaalenii]
MITEVSTMGSAASGSPTTVTVLIAGTRDGLPSASVTTNVTVFNPASAEVNVTDCRSC